MTEVSSVRKVILANSSILTVIGAVIVDEALIWQGEMRGCKKDLPSFGVNQPDRKSTRSDQRSLGLEGDI